VPPRRRDAVDDDFKRKVLAAVVLLLISLIHLIRLVLQWRVLVNQVEIPVWVSVVMCVVAGGLGVMVWREAKMTRALRKKVAPVA
jgi:intracellular septation protein A